MSGLPLDGFDLIAGDLDKLDGVQDWHLHDGGEPIRVIVRLDDGRRFTLSAEEHLHDPG